MSVRGDFTRLKQLSASMRAASQGARKAVLKAFAMDLQMETDGCFRRQQTPYGEPWPPLKDPPPRRRGGMILSDTARLRSSITARPLPSGVTVSSNVAYAGIHNYGGSVQHPARAQPRNRRGNRFISHAEAGKKQKASYSRLGVAASTRVSLMGAHGIGIPKRQYLPDARRGLPGRYAQLLREKADYVQQQLALGGV